MRYRKLTADGDYSFGRGQADFYINNREAVAQAVLTRLKLLTGEWFLDTDEGTPYSTQVLGMHTMGTYDTAIRARILETEGVLGIIGYSSNIGSTRNLSIAATIETIYGVATVEAEL